MIAVTRWYASGSPARESWVQIPYRQYFFDLNLDISPKTGHNTYVRVKTYFYTYSGLVLSAQIRYPRILTMHDIMFNTERPRIAVPTMPITIPMLWKASGMAKKPPPMVAFTMCISASLLLCGDFGASVDTEKKTR